MATTTYGSAGQVERRVTERRGNFRPLMFLGVEGLRISWASIWAGVLVAAGLMLLLAALGVAIGVTSVDPGDTDPGKFGAGAAAWAATSLLLSLFLGGLVATLTGAIYDRTTGLVEGVLVWVVSVLLFGWLATTGISMVAGGAFKLVTGIGAAAGMAAGAAGQRVDVSSGDVDQIVQRLNDPRTAQQISTATGIPQTEVQQTLSDTARKVDAARDNPGQAAAEARNGVARLYDQARSSGRLEQKAEEMKPVAARTAWGTFGSLLLSLIASMLGAFVGRRDAVVARDPSRTATTTVRA